MIHEPHSYTHDTAWGTNPAGIAASSAIYMPHFSSHPELTTPKYTAHARTHSAHACTLAHSHALNILIKLLHHHHIQALAPFTQMISQLSEGCPTMKPDDSECFVCGTIGCLPLDFPERCCFMNVKNQGANFPCPYCTWRKGKLTGLPDFAGTWTTAKLKATQRSAHQNRTIETEMGVHSMGPDRDWCLHDLCGIRHFPVEPFHCEVIGNSRRILVKFLSILDDGAVGQLNSVLQQMHGAGHLPPQWDGLGTLRLQANHEGLTATTAQQCLKVIQVGTFCCCFCLACVCIKSC